MANSGLYISKRGLDLIKRFEGLALRPYACPAGVMTIGFGHTIRPYERAEFKHGISEEIALQLLAQDVRVAEHAVNRLVSVSLTQGQYDAVTSFVFNLGSGAFQRSTLRTKLNREEHEDVPAEFMRWVFAGSRKLLGLIRRREAESLLYQQY